MPVFPELPVDSSCTDIFKSVSKSKHWQPFPRRASAYFQFPPDALPGLFSTPEIPVAVKDKQSADSGRPFSSKLPYADKDKSLLESTLVKLDQAALLGLRCSSSLTLLMAYIAFACDEDSPVSPNMATIDPPPCSFPPCHLLTPTLVPLPHLPSCGNPDHPSQKTRPPPPAEVRLPPPGS